MTAMRERFSSTELTALRNDLLQGGLVDSHEAAELLQVFLMGRGYGVSPQAALDADWAGRDVWMFFACLCRKSWRAWPW